MGLVKCSKCGTELNTTDMKCPNCGAINFGFNQSTNNEKISNSLSGIELSFNKEENMNIPQTTDKLQNNEEHEFKELETNNISFGEVFNEISESEVNSIPTLIEEEQNNFNIELDLSSLNEEKNNIEENKSEESILPEETNINNQENIEIEPISLFDSEQELTNNIDENKEDKDIEEIEKEQSTNDNNISQNIDKKEEKGIKCSNCGIEVSKKAKKCPNCGNKLKSNKLLIIAIIIFFIVLLAVIMFIIGSNNSLNINKKHDNIIESGGTTILENKDETEEPPQANQEESQTEITPEFEENIESEVTTEQAPVPTPEPAPAPVAPPVPPKPTYEITSVDGNGWLFSAYDDERMCRVDDFNISLEETIVGIKVNYSYKITNINNSNNYCCFSIYMYDEEGYEVADFIQPHDLDMGDNTKYKYYGYISNSESTKFSVKLK